MRFGAHSQPTGALHLADPLLRRTLKRQPARHCATLKQVLEDPTMSLAERGLGIEVAPQVTALLAAFATL